MIFLSGLVALAAAQNPLGLGGVPGQLPASSSNVRFQTVAQGTVLKAGGPGLLVFNNPVAWDNYWRDAHGGPGPVLERGFFNDWRLVAIHAGNRPTDGYGLGVLRIDRRIDRATVSALEVVPPRRSRPRGGATSPWIVLRVERGAFDLVLQTRQVEGYPMVQTVPGGTTVNLGNGVTATFAPGYCPP